MTSPTERTETVRKYYADMLEELFLGVDILTHSTPVNRMSSALMEQEKQASLKRIHDLIHFLENLRDDIQLMSTQEVTS